MKAVECNCNLPSLEIGECEYDVVGIQEEDIQKARVATELIKASKILEISNLMIKVAKSINAPKVTPNPLDRAYKNRRFKN
ncbi:hypothetical protein BN1195_03616 [Chryseobacterium oranimense G311]|uniref:hypothetical protein n=1 Tax=Chryseobacterium oranimense TaxID=421058 RepID=UPI000533B4B1|nr:hypothetical protein [Chryseobacterium oranimense]CEJ71271.1 hypothetical protein BN1195_03616 [Chryseobacterium oranimense G311]DAG72865.1 MAG TPA: hypothetical protein [Caudoviricetes sp.]